MTARSVFEVFGKGAIPDSDIRALAARLGGRVVSFEKGRQPGEGFGRLAIRAKGALRNPSGLVRFVKRALER